MEETASRYGTNIHRQPKGSPSVWGLGKSLNAPRSIKPEGYEKLHGNFRNLG
jgi:hypothetical protein